MNQPLEQMTSEEVFAECAEWRRRYKALKDELATRDAEKMLSFTLGMRRALWYMRGKPEGKQ